MSDFETATIRVVSRQHTRVTFDGERLQFADEGEVVKSVMRAGCARGIYHRIDGCQAEIESDEGTRPCANDAIEGSEFCGVHADG